MTTTATDPEPSAVYDGVTTSSDAQEVFRREYYRVMDEHKLTDGWKLPASVRFLLQEDLRRAECRVVRLRDRGPTGRVEESEGVRTARRARGEGPTISEARPTEKPDGSLTITCRQCNTEKLVSKFPTLSGRPGVRGDVCRECAKPRREETA